MPEGKGILCPNCGSSDYEVLKKLKGDNENVRYVKCKKCKQRFSTSEKVRQKLSR